MANTYSAGIVTAYGAAKKAGYTGTYEEFCAEQANFGRWAQQVRQDKESVEQTVENFSETTVPAAVQSVTDEGTRQVGLVNDAGTTQVGNVNEAGTNQVNAVNNAGAEQVQAVEDKGDEVIDSIPPDYSELSNAVFNDVTGLDTKAPVILETASGAIATFTDGADSMPIKKLVAQIEPVQDLHGYDSPWPAGGGTNKLALPILAQTAVPNTLANCFFLKAGQYTINAFSPVNCTMARLCIYMKDGEGNDLLTSEYNPNPTNMGNTGSYWRWGSDTAFPLQAPIIIAEDCYVRFLIGIGDVISTSSATGMLAEGTTYPSYSTYSNICPISGHTGAEIEQTGKNLFGGEEFADTIIEKVPNATIDTVNKTVSYTASKIAGVVLFDKFKPNTQYTIFLRNTGASNMDVRYTDSTGVGVTPDGITVTSASKSVEKIEGRWHTGETTVYYENFGIFEGVLTADDFVPYTGDQISVNWKDAAGTVYGGQFDAIAGKLNTTIGPNQYFKAKLSDNTSKIENINGSGYTRYQFYPTVSGTIVAASVRNNEKLCSIATYKYDDSGSIHWYHNIYGTISLFVPDGTDENTEAEFIIPLETAQETQLDPQEMTTLYGQNNIWSSTGDVEVTYPADTKLYIDGKLAEIQATILENIGG